MELGIVDSFKDKSILITGSTGFLAKIFVEKLLRIQPNLKKLYLLVRAGDGKSAAQRVQTDVIEKELFTVLRAKYGNGFSSFITEKVSSIAGDIVQENLGIEEPGLKEFLWKEIEIVINVAGTTNFYERYDVALDINVLGAKYILEFAKSCVKLEMLLHVSTAYVAGVKEGIILEEPFRMGETLNANIDLNIERELSLVEESKKELDDLTALKDGEKIAMKELGLKRARLFGWPNTYVFTKAMGEMILGHLRGNIPLVIMRPAIITSTYSEPLPGWIEGNRTVDSLITGYAKGNLPCFLGDTECIMDVIPGDLVVNAMIVLAAAHSNQHSQFIYHIGSSVSNPVKYSILEQCGYRYFKENPPIGKNGKIIKTKRIVVFRTMISFHRYMILRYRLPLEIFYLVNVVFCNLFSKRCEELKRKYTFVMRLVDLYEPYAFFKGCFDDLNLESLRMSMTKDTDEFTMLNFDTKKIDWDKYFYSIHIPGVLKYVLK